MNVRVIPVIIGIAPMLLFLALTLYRVQLGSVGWALAHADPIWIGSAIVAYAANLALRTRLWQNILHPFAPIPYRVANALLVGYGLKTILPARLGELFRTEFFKQTFNLSRVRALTSIVIERLFDVLTVVTFLGIGLLLTVTTRNGARIVMLHFGNRKCTLRGDFAGCALPSRYPLCRAFFRGFVRADGYDSEGLRASAHMSDVGDRDSNANDILARQPVSLVPRKAVAFTLKFADALVLIGLATLSPLVPSGPAYLGKLQFVYALAVEFSGGSCAAGVSAATLAQLCLLLPVALVATGLLIHGSGRLLSSLLNGHGSGAEAAGPWASGKDRPFEPRMKHSLVSRERRQCSPS